MCVRERVNVCNKERQKERERPKMCVRMCVCACVCACVCERERKPKDDRNHMDLNRMKNDKDLQKELVC